MVVKVRQGRKACTLVTGFEPYHLNAEDLAEELRKICASSTSGAYYLCEVGTSEREEADDPLL